MKVANLKTFSLKKEKTDIENAINYLSEFLKMAKREA